LENIVARVAETPVVESEFRSCTTLPLITAGFGSIILRWREQTRYTGDTEADCVKKKLSGINCGYKPTIHIIENVAMQTGGVFGQTLISYQNNKP
jgi:hypothetical protein